MKFTIETQSTFQRESKMTQDKAIDAVDSSSEQHEDAPPNYSPYCDTASLHPEAQLPPYLHPPPGTDMANAVVWQQPGQVAIPQPSFNTSLLDVGPESADVICPHCDYAVSTKVKSTIGTHAR